ncbi:MAG: alpha/beta hydrolase [Bacteroidetes bacterium]|nr:alpha/beta hydrolase [Bacteroidota bacterium]
MRYFPIYKVILLTAILLIPSFAKSQSLSNEPLYGNNPSHGQSLLLNGAKQYFEVYGQGEPLVLIHGNGGNIGYMKPQIKFFARKYKVIVMDCRGRGNSELGSDSLTYMQITKDVNDILTHLKIDSAYVVGRSDGGIIALLMGIYYPEKVKKIVAFAANLTPDTLALYPSFLNEVKRDRRQADEMLLKKDSTQNWKILQQRNRMMEFQPQISAGDLQKIKCPVLVMSTDRDIIQEEHTVYIYRNIPRANLSILAGESHYVTMNNPDLFNTTVQKYLDSSFAGEEMRK